MCDLLHASIAVHCGNGVKATAVHITRFLEKCGNDFFSRRGKFENISNFWKCFGLFALSTKTRNNEGCWTIA